MSIEVGDHRVLFENRLDQSKDPVPNIGFKGFHL